MPTTRVPLAIPYLCALASIVITGVSCGRDALAPTRDIAPSSLSAAGKPAGVAVSSASPSFGDRGTTVDVHVFGTGFTSGAEATWLLHGAADPSHVHTNKTTVLSSTELVANITVAADAQLAFWDVQVALLGGKNGVGSELFEITSAQILGSGTPGGSINGVFKGNDLLQVVGSANGGKTGSVAWLYDEQLGMVNLGSGEARGIDPLGMAALGANGNSAATVWMRQPDNSWHAQALPAVAGSVGGMVTSATRVAGSTLIGVGWQDLSGPRNTTQRIPVAWQLGAGGAWSAPQLYVVPSSLSGTGLRATDVNASGQTVGRNDSNGGIVWETPTTYTVLDGNAVAINPSGTLIVGQRSGDGGAVFWWRDPGTHQWHLPAVAIPSVGGASCPRGVGRDVNDAGIIVGWSCSAASSNTPTVWHLDLSVSPPVLAAPVVALPGLGVKNDIAAATTITNIAPYVVSGEVSISNSQRVAVRWRVQ